MGEEDRRDGSVAKADLRRVSKAVSRIRDAEEELKEAILAARASGETLRDIAEAAGISHQRVHQIVNEKR